MADASLTFLLENVKQLVLYHADLISGAKNDLEQLQNELEEMKSFLKDASDKRDKAQLFKTWERQIREVIYEAEDAIDTCVTAAAKEKGKNIIRRTVNPHRIDLAQKVRSLRQDKVKPVFDKVRDHIRQMGEGNSSNAEKQPQAPPKKQAQKPREENVVGFQDEIDNLIGFLTKETEEIEVISIVGMPGLGKTTVAWKIRRDPTIQYEFPTIIWVHVSNQFNKKDVFLTILKNFTQRDLSNVDEDDLARMVREYLSSGKFLLFMDDIWTTEAWDEIKVVLPKDNGSSKVLITSRNLNVAVYANRTRDPYQLRFLTKKESWELLQFEVFTELNKCHPLLEGVGEDIAHQCGGLPLAIIVIGGILLKTLSVPGGIVGLKNEWRIVADSVKTFLIRDDKNALVINTKEVIAWSYTTLPYELRDCFLYLGMFPATYEIPVWKLWQLWIAEGFIQPQPGRTLQEIARSYLQDLISRNLVMVEKTKPNGDVKTCRVHDMIREFCQKEAAFGQLNLFQEIRKSKDGVFEPPLSEQPKYRRLSIHSYVKDLISEKHKFLNARTFLSFTKSPVVLENTEVSFFTESFSLLRVLEANTMKIPRIPPKLPSLVHLRYVTLSGGDDLKVLPDFISDLWNLQTLIVDTTSRTLEVRVDIWKMLQLMHLKTKASIVLKMKERKGQEGGKNLQTLTKISPEFCTEDVFKKAKNLKTLGIRGKLELILDAKCFEKLDLLEKMKLVNDVFPKVASENPLHRLPESHRFPQNLKVLVLSSTFLDWTHMSTLGSLRKLEELKLKDNAFTGDRWDVEVASEFRNLEVLHIIRLDLKVWKASGDALPKLRSLIIKNCEKLEEVPISLEKSLEIFYIERAKFVVDSAKQIEEKKKSQLGGHRASIGGFKLIIAPGDAK